MEAGFTAPDFDVKPQPAPGVSAKYGASFLTAVRLEGFGRLKQPVNGKKYLAYESNSKTFFYADYPAGNQGRMVGAQFVPYPLASGSCAINAHAFPPTAKLITQAPALQTVFGRSNFSVSDIGGLGRKQIDIYWGEDNPSKLDPANPAGTNFTQNLDTPVILSSF